MSTTTSFPKTTAGKIFIVSGFSGGREVFLGKAIDEPYEERITLEGKILSFSPQGYLVARPFPTITTFFLKDVQHCVQYLSQPKAQEEAIQILNLSMVHIGRSSFPLIYRWIESACSTYGSLPWTHVNGPTPNTQPFPFQPERLSTTFGYAHPFQGLYQGFVMTAEQFRRALFQSRQVSSTRELDKLAELEGNLAIEIGKIANQIAIKFHQLATRENELFPYLEAFQGNDLPIASVRNSMAGWLFLFERLHLAKSWARRTGKVALVRDLNALIKDGIFGLNEVILDHCNSLDTLVTETFSQYGIAYEIHGELSPFVTYAGAVPSTFEREPIAPFVGSGA